jgi:hypothetical protein
MIDMIPNIIKELRRFYHDIDIKTENRMQSDDEIDRYHERLLDCDSIRTVFTPTGRLMGYVAYYRLDFDQLGRIICQIPFNALNENIDWGPICYLIDVTIDPEFRHTDVYKTLKLQFFQKNYNAQYFIGHAIYKKRSQPIRVFKRTEFMNKYIKEAVHGQG